MAVQVTGEVLSVRRVGAYVAMAVAAPGVAKDARPGQFVALTVGGPESAMLLRRAFAIYAASDRGRQGGTVEFVFSVHGRGSAWLAERRPHDRVDLVGPLGVPFRLPAEPVPCVLVGGGYGTAPLFSLAERLRDRGCRVDAVIGASTAERIFGHLEARRMAATLAVTTDDGSVGVRGRVSDVLPEVLDRGGARIVYACGPMPMLQAVSALAAERGVACQVAVEESMACGIGVCMTCVLPIVGEDGRTRMLRACVEGPVFEGSAVRWDALGTVPPDAVGAAAGPNAAIGAAGPNAGTVADVGSVA